MTNEQGSQAVSESPPTPTLSEPEPTQEAKQTQWDELPPGLPLRRAGNDFETFESVGGMEQARQLCWAVAAGLRPSALLLGPPGCGKTHLAVAALRMWYEVYRTGVFWKVPRFLAELQKLVFADDRNAFERVIEEYANPGFLLVLDDFGVHKATEWAGTTLYRIIDNRYENSAPTIITANVPLGAIDPRIVSRMRQGLVVCEAPDWRGRE